MKCKYNLVHCGYCVCNYVIVLKRPCGERHFVSSELCCGIGILHKSVDFSGIVRCDVA